MNKEYSKYLPIGSVVLLKKANKRIMITGYVMKSEEVPDKVWDYVGCLYPVGMQTSNKNLLFNHEDINIVYALGYSDDECDRYINFLKSNLNQ